MPSLIIYPIHEIAIVEIKFYFVIVIIHERNDCVSTTITIFHVYLLNSYYYKMKMMRRKFDMIRIPLFLHSNEKTLIKSCLKLIDDENLAFCHV